MPPDDERSNYGMAKRTLLDRLDVQPAAVHRMRGELGRDAGAEEYDRELGDLARFDLVLLGLGPDGHVASLYPDQPTLDESERRVLGAEAKLEPYVDRITLTLPMLRAAHAIVFLVAGEDKAEAAARAFAGEPVALDARKPRPRGQRDDDGGARSRGRVEALAREQVGRRQLDRHVALRRRGSGARARCRRRARLRGSPRAARSRRAGSRPRLRTPCGRARRS